MKISIGSNTFIATLYENETTKALKAMLPITLKMSELYPKENGLPKPLVLSNMKIKR